MSRSLKKGPYIEVKLEKKVLAMNESGKKSVVKTCLLYTSTYATDSSLTSTKNLTSLT